MTILISSVYSLVAYLPLTLYAFICLLFISLSLYFIFLKHPLAIGLTLITQTVLVCIAVTLFSRMPWFSYILFLIFLGATLVLFIYVATLASNETFKLSFPIILIALITLLSLILFSLLRLTSFFSEHTLFSQNLLKDSWVRTLNETNSTLVTLSRIYRNYNISLTGLIILYLLLTLLVVVKIRSTFFGPLRLS